MDVLRTGVSMLGALEPEKLDMVKGYDLERARQLADRLLACTPSILLYWYHFANSNQRIELSTEAKSIAEHFLTLLHKGALPSALHERSLNASMILYAEHGFTASTFAARVAAGTCTDMHSCMGGFCCCCRLFDIIVV